MVAFLADALVSGALMQALYSEHYAAIVTHMVRTVFAEHVDTWATPLRETVVARSIERDLGTLSKPQTKGYAKFVTHLHLEGFVERPLLEAWCVRAVESLATHEAIASEVLVWWAKTLSQTKVVRDTWKPYVREHIGPLWADDSALGMRARIRLMDVRDVYV